jgi:peptidoglycan/LPS O-acetylase OafA/YrhL
MPIWGMFRFAANADAIGNPASSMSFYVLYVGVILTGALFIYRFVEMPCRNAIRRRFQKRRQDVRFMTPPRP